MNKKILKLASLFSISVVLIFSLVFFVQSYSKQGLGDPCDVGEDEQCKDVIFGYDDTDDYPTYNQGTKVGRRSLVCPSGQCEEGSETLVQDCSEFDDEICGGDPETAYERFYSVIEGTYEGDYYEEEDGCCRPLLRDKEVCYDPMFCEIEDGESMCQSNPTVEDMEIAGNEDQDYCSGLDGIWLDWDYDSITNHSHEGSNVWIEDSGGSTVYNNDNIDPTTTSLWIGFDNLSYNSSYTWYVEVWDEWGNYGSDSLNFSTQGERVDSWFSWTPRPAFKDERVDFENESEPAYYDIDGYRWTFQNGDPASSEDENPSTEFISEGSNTVTLEVIEDGFSEGEGCFVDLDVNIRPELPDWEEVDPFR